MISSYWTVKGMEESDYGPVWGIPVFAWRDWSNCRPTGLWTWIQTLPYTKVQYYSILLVQLALLLKQIYWPSQLVFRNWVQDLEGHARACGVLWLWRCWSKKKKSTRSQSWQELQMYVIRQTQSVLHLQQQTLLYLLMLLLLPLLSPLSLLPPQQLLLLLWASREAAD